MAKPRSLPESRILQALRASGHGPMKPKQLARELKLGPEDYEELRTQLGQIIGCCLLVSG